jgi:hypothetical protein
MNVESSIFVLSFDETKETYLTLILEATLRIIREFSLTFGHVPNQQQQTQQSASNKQSLDASAEYAEQIEALKPCLKKARFSVEGEEEHSEASP